MTCYSSGVVGKKGANLALDDKQNSFQTGASWVAILALAAKKPLLITTLNVMSAFFVLFYVYMDILYGKFTSGKSNHTTNIYHGNSVPRNRT